MLEDLSRHFLFGRNNPPPTPESDEYSYNFGLTLDPRAKVEEHMGSEILSKGPYAVVRTSLANIVQLWS